MDLLKSLFIKALNFAGFNIPDVVNDDMSSDVDETSEERKARFAKLVDIEEDIKDEVSFQQQMERDMDAGIFDDEEVA